MRPAPGGEVESDEALMARAQADDVAAFEQLYDRHAQRAFRVARAFCSDERRAEDAVEEGFLAIWGGRAGYRPESGPFRAWSMKVVKDRAVDSLPPRDSISIPPREATIAPSGSEELLELLRRLPEAEAEVIVLAVFGELSHSEIAAQLRLPAGTVKGRIRLGLRRLRSEMGAAS